MKTRLFALTALLAIAALPAAAQTPDVLGKWNVTFTTQQGDIPSDLTLKKDGDKIVGTIASQMGEGSVQAQIKGSDLSISFVFQSQQGPINVEMLGAVSGKSAKGTFTAGQSQGSWTATKAEDAKDTKDAKDPKDTKAASSVTGSWNVSLQLGEISANPMFELKQDGEKLTGDYISQAYGKFPVTGTVKGSDVAISFNMTIEGNAFAVTYSGKLEKDEIKGSVDFGGQMSGTFTAARKK